MKKANAVMTAAALVFLSLSAWARVQFDSSINYYQDGEYQYIGANGAEDSQISYQSFSGGPWSGWLVANGESFGMTSGYANAANMKMGAKAQVTSTPMNTHLSDASISTAVSNRLTVTPGTSGLAEGDTTTLAIKVRLDGTLHGEATSYPGKGWSHAEMRGGLSVHDDAIQIDLGGDGIFTPTQASFDASCDLEAYDVYFPVWDYNYSTKWNESWRTQSNISSQESDGNSWTIKQFGESFHYVEGNHFDTGELTLMFDAIVGHTLDFDADLFVYIDAANDAMTWADFGNTFALNVTPMTSGVGLSWDVVPEPATMLLLGIGGLLIRRK
jgi:hypothetical protein